MINEHIPWILLELHQQVLRNINLEIILFLGVVYFKTSLQTYQPHLEKILYYSKAITTKSPPHKSQFLKYHLFLTY